MLANWCQLPGESSFQTSIQTTPSIFDLHIGVNSEKYNKNELDQYAYIASFRRWVYIACDEEVTIPTSILLTYEGESYRIFLNENEVRCHTCHALGHISEQCIEIEDSFINTVPTSPENIKDSNQGINNTQSSNPLTRQWPYHCLTDRVIFFQSGFWPGPPVAIPQSHRPGFFHFF